MTRLAKRLAGERIAECGACLYRIADEFPELESSEDFQQLLSALNKLEYRLLKDAEDATHENAK